MFRRLEKRKRSSKANPCHVADEQEARAKFSDWLDFMLRDLGVIVWDAVQS